MAQYQGRGVGVLHPQGVGVGVPNYFFCFLCVYPVEVVDVVAAPIDGTTPTQATNNNLLYVEA